MGKPEMAGPASFHRVRQGGSHHILQQQKHDQNGDYGHAGQAYRLAERAIRRVIGTRFDRRRGDVTGMRVKRFYDIRRHTPGRQLAMNMGLRRVRNPEK